VVLGVLRTIASPLVELVTIAVLLAVGVWSASVTERYVGRTDPGIIVIDEIVGMLLTFAYLNVGFGSLVFGFVLFRVFDIIKPYPARACERLPGGWGVMADDLVAALYAQAVLRGGIWVIAALGA
jgi:phosphatidylglycerophosphatase A|tara:strand:+ start:259 stop:633 length:375 start_codon:yes stop_codon:yes gene_type:complete